ncbi:MAG: DUF2993 domain-containing protein [Actinomycetota bacterium]|nr:DUF2993 domain-containing protein [Actinomycetota bacterium]
MLGLIGGVLLVGVLAHTVLPVLIEARLAASMKDRYELEEEPRVEIYSNFPAKLLLGRIDRIEVHIDSYTREGILLRDLRMNLEDVDVAILSPLRGDLEGGIQRASLVAEVPEESINEYLRENELGLAGREIDVRPQEVIYRDANVLFGLPASVGLDLGVVGPYTVEVVPEEVTVGWVHAAPFSDGTTHHRRPDAEPERATSGDRACKRRALIRECPDSTSREVGGVCCLQLRGGIQDVRGDPSRLSACTATLGKANAGDERTI